MAPLFLDFTLQLLEVVLQVADMGTGIPESEVPLIFDRFHRVEGASGRTHEGTGIGLALVQELVKFHKGSVSVESVLGQGTTFTVRIPFGSAHLPQDHIGGSRNQASTATRADAFSEALRWLPDAVSEDTFDGGGEAPVPVADSSKPRAHVLVADDNTDMREYLTRLLAMSYDVVAVANGEEALIRARQSRPDLILTDVMMPRVDGFQLLRRVVSPGRRGSQSGRPAAWGR
jgi:Histidine kinase-, DNA gyrase B-, and HSP90-like ATPase/Response regulator receiver domain